MGLSSETPHWTRHIFYRSQHVRTTWKFRVAFVALVLILGWVTRVGWTVAIARSLVCDANVSPSDAILVENFDLDYLVFDRAARLRRAGLAVRVIVPVPTDEGTSEANIVASGMVKVMADVARIGPIDIVPIRQIEPITLTAAQDLLRFLERERIHSLIVVSPLFRSRRSLLIYDATLGRAGITLKCEPVQGSRGVETWTDSWHGVQEVATQWLKLQYYRFYVLPFKIHPNST